MGVCSVCFQPECPESRGAMEEMGEFARPAPGPFASRLEPGQHEPRGYGEWVVHPEEAIFVLHRGYAVVDGRKEHVRFIHNEPLVTQLKVYGTSS